MSSIRSNTPSVDTSYVDDLDPNPLPDAGHNDPLGSTKYAERLRRRRNFTISNKLHGIGINAEISLPQISVLGSQSAGKSSLIEAISGVTLPRASGTCTRCPTECILTQSDGPWSCEVSLRFQYDNRGQPLAAHRNIRFGPIITDPAQVEDRLRRAQAAILNPALENSTFPDSFLVDTILPETRATSFSRNFISMTVKGPEVVDLSFVDLPGIIATVARGGQQSDIEDVKALANNYISNKTSIVLLTITCETDFENQGAWQIGKAHDPNGVRTIGVLTKPDRIEEGNQGSWFSLLRNEKVPLEHEWFCVKLPGPEELRNRISGADARLKEDQFFTQLPWSTMEDVRPRLSVKSLTERLSDVLSDVIAQELPRVQAEIDQNIKETEKELQGLPKDFTHDPINKLVGMLGEFQRHLDSEIKGTTSPQGLIQKINRHLADFRTQLRGTAPRFVPFDRGTRDARCVPSTDFLDEQEKDLGENGTLEIIYLDEVKRIAESAISRELPNNVPFDVKRDLIRRSIMLWEHPCEVLFTRVQATLEAHFNDITRIHFADYPALLQAISAVLSERRSSCRVATEVKLKWMREVEENATFTLNLHYLEDYKVKFEEKYKMLRRKRATSYSDAIHMILHPDEPKTPPTPEPLSPRALYSTPGPEAAYSYTRQEAMACVPADDYCYTPVVQEAVTERSRLKALIRTLDQFGLPCDANSILKLLPRDSADEAIEIMADVRAYWQVAFKRFMDYSALAIDMDYVRGFGKELNDKLRRQLGADDEGRCREYFALPAHVVARRTMLRARLIRLEDAQREIASWAA